MDRMKIQADIVEALKTVHDPEIPVNVYDLGLIYRIELDDANNLEVDMTLTAPNCPIADNIVRDVHEVLEAVNGVKSVKVHLTFDPPWDKDKMSDEAKLELGFL